MKLRRTHILPIGEYRRDVYKRQGLDAGANDYMEKPFHLQELEARIRSLTRRKFVQNDICLKCGEIKFDTIKREAYAKGEPVPLTRKENGILEYLLINIGRPVSQDELIEHVWDATADSFSCLLYTSMNRWLRLQRRAAVMNLSCSLKMDLIPL